ncbi:glycosyltransferase family 2 protein [Flavobacterium sp. F372]|uniref:Glycosyltransferase family 2 protein n=1 Tax=Flavobacterium bernardetii TaxID=2813823 RepID=A0ABR7J2A0_9FLAO|nr:glycosyltransferase family 2 protein [Flavobacterium bernardetii]MBC5836156.1 glycosyltransferase family 2 protein [Flavobacterium bernardetii]NHF71341.1 glycosyltransferase family 2 protein [Flavobacterium bernardetii]
MPFFTVIIPLYNKEKYISGAIESILNQTFTDFELLIVNDCSSDKSVEMASKFVSEKVHVIHHEKNSGLAATRNTGIKKATSNYVTFLDADDLWRPFFLEKIYNLIQNFPEARIFGTNYEEIWDTTVKNPHNNSDSLPEEFVGYVNFFKINIKQGLYNHGSVCFHKEVYENVGFYNENIQLSQDLDFNIRANYHYKLAYDNSVQMSYFMQTDNQLTRSSIVNKTIPDYDLYEDWAKTNSDLKKYLDFERYVLGKRLKKNNDLRWKKMIANINENNLNWKQNLLLKVPRFVLNFLDKVKLILLKLGIKPSTY